MSHESWLKNNLEWRQKIIFQLLQKTHVPGIQNKTNNIKIDSENKSISVI